jgi:tRNA-uridine 2-sulfurtransferase
MAPVALRRRRAAPALSEGPALLPPFGVPSDRRPVVAVAMSGGVDSSVAAALCADAGWDVFGVMLRLWSEPGAAAPNACCTLEALDDAQAVAVALDIPFSVIDAGAVFRRAVVDRFLVDAVAGDTPNPCLRCNRDVRFGFLLDHALALGADALATGHYARVDRARDGAFRLRRGVDRGKDQSYVLHALDQDQLAHAVFPVGMLTKVEVRAAAARRGLAVADRAESVDLCWLGADGLTGFLGRHLPEVDPNAARPGPIVDRTGRLLGEHRGLPFYTHGQRRGLGIATGAALYVVGKDACRNVLIVGPADALGATTVHVRDMRWVAGTAPAAPVRVEAQIRYRSPAAPAQLVPGPGATAEMRFDVPQRAPTPGQALVVYDGDICLGGGRIAGQASG